MARSLHAVPQAESDLEARMLALGRAAAAEKAALATASRQDKDKVLRAAAVNLRAGTDALMRANAKDVSAAKTKGHNAARLDRMALDAARIRAMADALEAIAELEDPVGATIGAWARPNGLQVQRVRVPLGVIGIIYESRPNVTAEAAALCFKSGNAVILRPSSEIQHSARHILDALTQALTAHGFAAAAAQLVPSAARAAVGHMLAGLGGQLDVLVPRGGRSLVARVQKEARVPVFGHLEGVCHTYIHRDANRAMACAIVRNAKLRRPGICGATESVLVDKAIAATHVPPIVEALAAEDCIIWGDAASRQLDARVRVGTPAHWAREYLAKEVSLIQVDGLDAAIAHIAKYGSAHTDAIVTDNKAAAEKFLAQTDSAIVMHNCSTQFADGGELGMGAEVGIATGRFHARGPVGLEQLTTMKYRIRGSGQTRP